MKMMPSQEHQHPAVAAALAAASGLGALTQYYSKSCRLSFAEGIVCKGNDVLGMGGGINNIKGAAHYWVPHLAISFTLQHGRTVVEGFVLL